MVKLQYRAKLILFTFLVSVLLSACSENTDIEFLPSAGSQSFTNPSEFVFDTSFIEFVDGKAQLKPLDLEESATDFVQGQHYGSALTNNQTLGFSDKTSDHLKLSNILPQKAQNLIGYWPLDGTGTDESGNNHGGNAVGGISYTTNSQIGAQSGSFNGTDSLLEIENSSLLSSLPNQFSVSTWVYLNSKSNYDAFISKSSKTATNTEITLRVGLDSSVDQKARVQIRTSDGAFNAYSLDAIPLSTWTHIVATYDGSSLKIYTNGILQDTAAVTGTLDNYSNPQNVFSIGTMNYPTSSVYYIDGLIDEMGLWNSSLNEDEVSQIYFQQKQSHTGLSPNWTPKWNNVVGYWSLDGHWQDSSGNGNHGAPQNDAAFNSGDAKVGTHSGSFDGTSDCVFLGKSGLTSTSGTLSLWIKDSGSTNNYSDYISFLFNSSDYFRLEKNPSYNYSVSSFSGGVDQSIYNTGVPITTTWTHVAVTFQDSDFLKVYINGEFTGSQIAYSAFANEPVNIYLGCRESGLFESVNAFLDDVVAYNIPLNEIDIYKLYDRQKQKRSVHFDSQVVDTGNATSSWLAISISSDLPFWKELVGDFDNNGLPDDDLLLNYVELSGGLSSGLEAYWRFNETSWVNDQADALDSSGNNNHLTIKNGAAPNLHGQFASAGSFDGTNDFLVTSNFITDKFFTFSAWVKFNDISPSSGLQIILWHDESIVLYTDNQSLRADYLDSGLTNFAFNENVGFEPYQWYHLALTSDGSTFRLFLNGSQVGSDLDISTGVGLAPGLVADEMQVGKDETGTRYLSGLVDETAIWSRGLTSQEIEQLYRRGANRIKWQVRSCVDANCNCNSFNTSPVGSADDCDGDGTANSVDTNDTYKANFTGPGGDDYTYYSEILNRPPSDLVFNCAANTSDSDANVCVKDEIIISNDPQQGSPKFNFADLPITARPATNRYFQYRVYLEADDNNSCSGAPCLPEVENLKLNPDSPPVYYGQPQEIKTLEPLKYGEIKGIEITADICVTYQLSANDSDYYYWNGTSWTQTISSTQTTQKADLEENIVSFSQLYNTGLLYMKAFLSTDATATSPCTITDIKIDRTR